MAEPSNKSMPAVFIPHGGGPRPFVDVGFGNRRELDGLSDYLRSLPGLTLTPPRAILVISAHWEEEIATVNTCCP